MRAYILHIILLGVLLLSPRASAQINTEQVMRVGQNALYFEDYVLSIQYFNQVINAKPGMAQPYLMRAIAKLNLDDLRGAEADASRAIELNRFLTDAWEVRGVARQNLGKNAEAIKDYDEALKLLPRNRQMMYNRAMALCEVGDTAAASQAYADLLRYYPNFANGYMGRGRLRLQVLADTVGALQDIETTLGINPNALNAYLMRASIAIDSKKDYQNALADMDRAIKLEPRMAGLYINRAFLRHELVDYFGAMADYDYALMLEPLNPTALFNRSLLEMEVADYDKALADLSKILELDPDDYRARYNRAVVFGEKRDFDSALADINMVIDRFPDFSGAHYLRSEYLREKGQLQQAKAAYDKAWALAKAATNSQAETPQEPEELSPEKAANRFNTLLTTKTDTPLAEEYNNEAIRGRVQDRNINIEMEPLIEISYYTAPTELRQGSYYIKEVDDINATRMLRFLMAVTPNPPSLTDPDMIKRHFSSIDYYNSYISTHAPRAIDYIGRAMDFITVKNYDAAITDMDRAIALTPDHSVAYLLRAQARYHARADEPAFSPTDLPGLNTRTISLRAVLDDYDKAIELQPSSAIAWYDKGVILFELGDLTSAIASFTKAIELQPSLGHAYYNRGYIYLKMGNQQAGIADLSKAGELGIVGAYNLIKRLRY